MRVTSSAPPTLTDLYQAVDAAGRGGRALRVQVRLRRDPDRGLPVRGAGQRVDELVIARVDDGLALSLLTHTSDGFELVSRIEEDDSRFDRWLDAAARPLKRRLHADQLP